MVAFGPCNLGILRLMVCLQVCWRRHCRLVPQMTMICRCHRIVVTVGIVKSFAGSHHMSGLYRHLFTKIEGTLEKKLIKRN